MHCLSQLATSGLCMVSVQKLVVPRFEVREDRAGQPPGDWRVGLCAH